MSPDDRPELPGDEGSRDRWPVGFMLLIGATALYLGWRLVQGIGWAIEWFAG